MTRTAWIVLSILVLALGVYAFRPAPAAPTSTAFITASATRYTLEAAGHVQDVDGEQVRLDGLARRLDANRAQGLWMTIGTLAPDPARVVAGVSQEQLSTFGLGNPARLEGSGAAGTVHLRWGRSGAQAYVWDGVTRRLAAVNPADISRLDQAAGRLDERQAVPVPQELARIQVDAVAFAVGGEGWMAEGQPQRPRFDARVRRLLQLVQGVTLDDLTTTVPTGSTTLATITYTVAQTTHRLDLLEAADALWIRADALPPQRAADPAAWREAVAGLRRDQLVDATSALMGRDRIEAVRAVRDGRPLLSLVRGDELAGHRSGHRWEVVWSGGREPAAPEAMGQLIDVIDTLQIREPVLDPLGTTMATGLVVTIETEGGGKLTIAQSDDGTLRAGKHRGVAVDAQRLPAAITPAALLDRRLAIRNPQRIVKIQRRQPALNRAEVLARRDGGLWTRTWPAPAAAADNAAVDHLVRVIAASTARSVDLVQTAEQRARVKAILAAPEAELAVRYAPADMGQAANDETDLDETASQDWGLALVRTTDGWLGTDADGALLYALEADTVEALLAPAEGGRLFPIVPAVVTALDVVPAQGQPWRIERASTGWKVVNGGTGTVSDVAVRRLLRDLTALAGTPDATLAEPDARSPALVVEVPGLGSGRERLRLALPAAGGVWVGSDRVGSGFPRGGARSTVTIPALAELQAP